MLTKIPISSIWQVVNLTSQFRNNSNVRIMVQQTADSNTEPTEEGIVVKPYESFTVPSDGLQYWAKTFHGSAELIVDPIGILDGGSGSGSGDTSVVDSGTGTFGGAGVAEEITFDSAGDLGYQVIITVQGDSSVAGYVGEITVDNSTRTLTTAEIYNSGRAGDTFNWVVLKNA